MNCNFAAHGIAVQEIFNHEILHTTALYEYEPRHLGLIHQWFVAKAKANLPVIGAVNTSGELMGFASYGPFRPHAAFVHTAEHSLYIAPAFQGQGLGKQLLNQIIMHAKLAGLHTLIAGIDAENKASIALHQALGFNHTGTIYQAGYKFERWLDLCFYQLILTN